MIREIKISEATDLPEAFCEALERWKIKADEIMRETQIQWYARLASTTFKFNEKYYVIYPEHVFAPEIVKSWKDKYMDGVLDAGFELMQSSITDDLVKLGATNIRNFGFLD
jgi:hypothetical protein